VAERGALRRALRDGLRLAPREAGVQVAEDRPVWVDGLPAAPTTAWLSRVTSPLKIGVI
jgi:hypothetical protein